jgi:hypothetical protein
MSVASLFIKRPRRMPLRNLPDLRFWDESVRALGLFDKHWQEDDIANAVPCFDRMARHRYWELTQSPEFDPTKKSIISSFQPKSGGTYLHNRMLELGYKEFWWCFPDRICHSYCYPGFDALNLFMSGGCTCHTHARPTPTILASLDRAGVEKIWVHLRNPAESLVSSYYHFLGEGHGDGSVGEKRRQDALSIAARHGVEPGIDISAYAVNRIDWFVEWVAEWLRFAVKHPELVILSYFTELADPEALLARVFDQLGIDITGALTVGSLPQDRVRKTRAKDWRSEVSIDAGRHVERRVRAGIEDFPQFTQLWT